MYTHNTTNGDMLLNDLVDYSLLPCWTNLNNLNSHSVWSVPEKCVRTNGVVKRQQKTHYEKGVVSQLDNRFANIGHPDCPTVMKYPRVFQPVILQQHPEYSTQILPQPDESTLLSRKPFISNDGNTNSHPDFLCSYVDLNKQENDEKYYKRIFQLQFSISESARRHRKFSSDPDFEVTSKFLTLNSPEANFQSMNSPVKHTHFDFPYVPGSNQQNVNRQDKWESFQNHQFKMMNTEVENTSFNVQRCPYRKPDVHKQLIPNWLSAEKEMNKTDRFQPYYEGLTNSKDSSSFNHVNSSNDPSNYEAYSKRSAFGKPIFTLENTENSFSNIHNFFNGNSEQSAVLSNENNFSLYYSPLQKKIVTNKFMCPYCKRLNSSPAQLKIHLRIHTGERPYVCDIAGCDKTFTRNEELTRHLKIHSGDRPYICKICQRRFGRKDHLTKHEVTHRSASDKKVHICLVAGCKQRYTRSDALARHRWNVHLIRAQVRNLGARKNQIRKKQRD